MAWKMFREKDRTQHCISVMFCHLHPLNMHIGSRKEPSGKFFWQRLSLADRLQVNFYFSFFLVADFSLTKMHYFMIRKKQKKTFF